MRKEAPYVCCRICLKEVLAISAEEHTTLCLERYHAKKKTRDIDTKLLEISNKITNEISNESKTKASSALLKKRNILESEKLQKSKVVNTPQIGIRSIDRLKNSSLTEENKIVQSSVQFRALNMKHRNSLNINTDQRQEKELKRLTNPSGKEKPQLPRKITKPEASLSKPINNKIPINLSTIPEVNSPAGNSTKVRTHRGDKNKLNLIDLKTELKQNVNKGTQND